jgi:hypothetical protein
MRAAILPYQILMSVTGGFEAFNRRIGLGSVAEGSSTHISAFSSAISTNSKSNTLFTTLGGNDDDALYGPGAEIDEADARDVADAAAASISNPDEGGPDADRGSDPSEKMGSGGRVDVPDPGPNGGTAVPVAILVEATAGPDPSVTDEDAAAEAGGVVTAGGPLRSTPLTAR